MLDNIWSTTTITPKGNKPPDLEGHSMNHFRHGVLLFGGQVQEKGLTNDCYMLQIGGLKGVDIPSSIDLFGKFQTFHYSTVNQFIQYNRCKFVTFSKLNSKH